MEALGISLENLGGDKGFRTHHEPVLLAILAVRLVSGEEIPRWLVEKVQYHYRYNEDRVLASTDYRYDVTSQRDGPDFFINYTAPANLGSFELVSWKNCELVEQNQLSGRTVELHFRLSIGAPGSRTHFSYRLRPTDPHISKDVPPLLATIGQLGVALVRYLGEIVKTCG